MRNKINLEAKLAYEKIRGEKNKFGSYHKVLHFIYNYGKLKNSMSVLKLG